MTRTTSPVSRNRVLQRPMSIIMLLIMGWQGDKRIKNIMIHLRLKGEKIWIEEDWTEDGVATDLLQAGVPRDDIVLAFHPPHLRQYTEFASV